MAYKIEKNVPFPDGRTACKYPFLHMEVGDSFLIPNREVKKSTGSVIRATALRCGVKIKTRTTPNGMRVWLTSQTRE